MYSEAMRQIVRKHYPDRTGFGAVYEHVVNVDAPVMARHARSGGNKCGGSKDGASSETTDGSNAASADDTDYKYMADAVQAMNRHADYTIET